MKKLYAKKDLYFSLLWFLSTGKLWGGDAFFRRTIYDPLFSG